MNQPGQLVVISFQHLHTCNNCAERCPVENRVFCLTDLVRKVTTELTMKAAFQAHSTERDIIQVIELIGKVIWEHEDLENRSFDGAETPDNERGLEFARIVARAAFQN